MESKIVYRDKGKRGQQRILVTSNTNLPYDIQDIEDRGGKIEKVESITWEQSNRYLRGEII